MNTACGRQAGDAQAPQRCIGTVRHVALVRAGASIVDGLTVESEDQRDAA
jgi:hypothetical protein